LEAVTLEGLPLGGISEVTCWWVRENHAAQRAGLKLIPLYIKKKRTVKLKNLKILIVKNMVVPITIILINIWCKILI
jgi:hypothetical protein